MHTVKKVVILAVVYYGYRTSILSKAFKYIKDRISPPYEPSLRTIHFITQLPLYQNFATSATFLKRPFIHSKVHDRHWVRKGMYSSGCIAFGTSFYNPDTETFCCFIHLGPETCGHDGISRLMQASFTAG